MRSAVASLATAALVLLVGGRGITACTWDDPDEHSRLTVEQLRGSTLFDAPLFDGVEPEPQSGAGRSLAVSVERSPDAGAAVTAILASLDDERFEWRSVMCSSDIVVVTGSERFAGHLNPVEILGDFASAEVTATVRGASNNSEPPSDRRSSRFVGCPAADVGALRAFATKHKLPAGG